MMSNHKCPICDKIGLEDFRKHKVVCQNCGTDLSVFLELDRSIIKNKQSNMLLIFSILTLIIMIFVAIELFKTRNSLNEKEQEYRKLSILQLKKNENISQLNDSINSIMGRVRDSAKFIYTVKKGDSFCHISYLFFNTERFAHEIAQKNGKEINSIIYPGTELIIPKF